MVSPWGPYKNHIHPTSDPDVPVAVIPQPHVPGCLLLFGAAHKMAVHEVTPVSPPPPIGAVAVAEFIAESPRLLRLDLRENEIKTGGLMALALALKVNQSLLRLDLDRDPKKEAVRGGGAEPRGGGAKGEGCPQRWRTWGDGCPQISLPIPQFLFPNSHISHPQFPPPPP